MPRNTHRSYSALAQVDHGKNGKSKVPIENILVF